MTETTEAATAERLHALDLVRAAALLLGIVFHAAIPFLPDLQLWLVVDQVRSTPVEWLAFTLHTFRMTTFFILAGYFGRMLLVRRGTRGFVRDRGKRVLLPLLIFWLPVLILYVLALALAASLGATPDTGQPPEPPAFTLTEFPLTHLWFLYVLSLLYVAALLLRTAVGAIDRSGALRGAVDKLLAGAMRVPFVVPLAAAAVVAALLIRHEAWPEWWGIPTPDRGLVPNLAAFGSFGLAFGLGWLVHRSSEGFAPLARFWALYLVAALAVTVACQVLVDTPLIEPQLEGRERSLFAVLYAAAAWLWTFGLIGAALRFIRAESPAIRYLADSSYWLYIVHLPLLVALEGVVAHWPVPAEIKLVLVVGVGTAIMLASYHWMVRSTFIGALLNGRRYPRKRAATPVAA